MTTWLDKPDADGLWFRQPRILSGSMTVCYVWGNKFRYVYYVHEGKACACAEEWLSIKDDAVWGRITLTKPEPYQPPTPPKVEWFTGWRKGVFCYIAIIGERYIATNEKGESFSGVWYGVGEHDFATARPMESPP